MKGQVYKVGVSSSGYKIQHSIYHIFKTPQHIALLLTKMQFSTVFTFVASLAVATASVLPDIKARAEGNCGLDTYNNAYFCIIDGVVCYHDYHAQ